MDPSRPRRQLSKPNYSVPGLYGVWEGEYPSNEIHGEMPEQFDPYANNSSLSGGQQSYNRYEIEPGHYDFLQDEASQVYSRQCSSEPSSSSKGDSSHSSRGYSSHSSGTSGKLTLSQFMADWVEEASLGGTPRHYDPPASEPSSFPRSGPEHNPETHPSRAGAHPSRGGAQPNRVGAQPNRVGAQPLLTSYTWEEVVAMTGGSKYEVGRGGFGSVYMGLLNSNTKVAVKILNDTSRQGDSEFLNEVNLLSRVNHVNLVKLLGYCQEGSNRVLVYEFAEKGTLWDHIHGKVCNNTFLDWKSRLKIGLEAASGLEYLHTGCTQRIIHRDIKSSNILLTKHLIAKVADFGLSKMGSEHESGKQTHMTTMVKGTPGYLDPEYLRTCQLNEKSDIFSFGVVLLEIVTGRRPIDQNANKCFIGDWVKGQWKSGGMKGAVDPKLGGSYNPKSMKIVITLALKCIENSAGSRPDIRIVVEQLRAAIMLENNSTRASKWSLKSLLSQS